MNQFTNRRAFAAAAVSVAVLIPLLVFGAPALARSVVAASQYQYGGSSQYKVAICHHTHSKKHPFHVINVGAPAVKAHLRHGDTLAPCPTTAPPQAGDHGKGKGHGHEGNDDNNNKGTSTTSPTSPTTGGDQHGKSGDDHGKSGDDHGNGNSNGNGHGNGNGGGNGKGHGK